MNSKLSNTPVTRRRFLGYVVGGVSGIITAAVATPLIGYFVSPIWKKSKPIGSPIARVNEIPIGEPKFVTCEERVRDGWYITTLSKGAWVVNKGNEMVVFDPRCTHLNCPYYWDKERGIFQCPCHDGRYDIDGNVLHGPSPSPLDRLEFHIDDDTIVVTGKLIRGEPGSRESWQMLS
ncbi:MAG: Rieske 2Fe-2S domain-containing protein [Proteobacteria bacterium]|nr:Rieske 2Fe-2S domain-containing protein [Pseudomonadota bacterium]